ncbi:carboxypeptidase-like protein S1 [Lactarius quietus]|nr:carboxypeptidase-like protein S1 [Lactarius quietus]
MFGISGIFMLVTATFATAPSVLVDRHSYQIRNGTIYNVFDHAATGATLSFVNNSGVCETTPDVNQYSGYLSVGTNMSMWFWFFEARNSSSTAPLAMWLNGGPGCSSMIGLFQENGPCTFNNVSGSTPVLNPYSWNSYANMLYVDQPIGTGFSFGTDDVNSTVTAAPFYVNRNFGLFTESYGAHFAPEFAVYFEFKNIAIQQGTISGVGIPLVALGINNGWAASYFNEYYQNCLPGLETCDSPAGTNAVCSNADNTCFNQIEGSIQSVANFDINDLRAPLKDPFPSDTYISYLQNATIQSKIAFNKFLDTGDDARTFIPTLSTVIQSGIQVLIWAGDADWNCNTAGVEAVIAQLQFAQSAEFNSMSLVPYTVNGMQYGVFKTAGNLSFLRVFNAGHEVPAYQPLLSLQVFTQTLSRQPLSST